MFETYFSIMLGGALGTGLRLFLSTWVDQHGGASFPWGTLIVNFTGCLAIGLFSGFAGPEGVVVASPLTRQIVMIGLLGGFTTFSSFSLQTISLIFDGEWLYAGMNVFLSLVLCLAGTLGGVILARSFLRP